MPDVSTPAGAPGSLSPLTLSASTGVAGQPFTATISGKTSGSTLKLIDGAGGVFTLSGTTISAPAGVLPSQYDLEVIESLPGFFGSPSVNLFPVAITPMTLNALSPSASSGTAGTAFSSTLSGMQSGSQLAILRAPPGYSLSGGVLSRAQGPSPGGDVVIIREINPLSANSYRDTTLNISAPLNLPPGPGPTPPPVGPVALKIDAAGASPLAPVSLSAFSTAPAAVGARTVTFDTSVKGQFGWMGVGDALTPSACYVLMTQMSAAQRTAILTEKYGTNKFNLVRISMGDCDYTYRSFYSTYDDTDPVSGTSLPNFSTAMDEQYIVPVLQQVLAINPNVKIQASPWSPPVVLKSSGATLTGGSYVQNSANNTWYAAYFVKFIQAYQTKYNIPIYAVAVQNEAGNSTTSVSCTWASADMVAFTKVLGAAIAAAGLSTVVMGCDDDYSAISNWVSPILADSTASSYVPFFGMHSYVGNDRQMPGALASKPWIVSEISPYWGGSNLNFQKEGAWVSSQMICSSIQNGCTGMMFWNSFLNAQGGPANKTASSNISPTVTINGDGSVVRNAEYYLMAILGRYVQLGAYAIDSTSYDYVIKGITAGSYGAPGTSGNTWGQYGSDIESVAWLNPDGTTTVFIWNGCSTSQSISLEDAAGQVRMPLTLAAGDMVVVAGIKNAVASAVAPPAHYLLTAATVSSNGLAAVGPTSTAANSALNGAFDLIVWEDITNSAQTVGNFSLFANWSNATAANAAYWFGFGTGAGTFQTSYTDSKSNVQTDYVVPSMSANKPARSKRADNGIWRRCIMNGTGNAITTFDGIVVPAGQVRFMDAYDNAGQPGAWNVYGIWTNNDYNSILANTAGALSIGKSISNNAYPMGRIYKTILRDPIAGTVVNSVDFTQLSTTAAGGTFTDQQGGAWTLGSNVTIS